MRNRSACLNLNNIRKVITRIKESEIRREEHYMTHVTKTMQYYTRISMHLTKGRDSNMRRRTRVMEGSIYSVGLVARIIAGKISYNIRVADHRFTVLRRHK